MFRTLIIIVAVVTSSFMYSQNINKSSTDERGNKKLLGVIDKDGLTQEPFNSWFTKNYDSYLANEKVVEKLKNSLTEYKITVFLGTWCGDSKREVPRFYNVLEGANFHSDQLKVIAVDNDKKSYKQSPGGEEKGLNIHKVPTFIFYKDGKEVNRIVEYPKETLEKDMLKITTGQKYSPSYIAANYLHTLFETKTLQELEGMENNLVPRLSQALRGVSELNTYGLVLLRSNQSQKALYVLGLNAKIFPYHYYTYTSLGKAYFESKDFSNALKNYKKSLALNSANKSAISMIQEIEGMKK
jgi:thiol-disulfide isomerase/thioredoxin